MVLPAGSRRIEIEYTAPSFAAPEKVRFQVKLEGRDPDWQDSANRHTAYLYEIPSGKYIFRVRAANDDGIVNETGASLAFAVLPFFWQTSWFRGLIGFAVLGEAGLIVGLLANRRRLNRTQADLVESERRLKLAGHAARLGMWVWEIGPDEIWISEEGRSLFGWGKMEAVNFEKFIATLHADDREPTRQAVRRSLEGQGNYEAEYRVCLGNGATHWITARGRVEFNGEHKPIRMRGVSTDITARKQAEEKFRLAVEASPSGIIIVNQRGQILLVNALTEKSFGYTRDELVGQSMEMLVPDRFRKGHSAHRTGFFEEPSARAMGAGRELFARRKDASEFPVEIGLNPINTEEGRLVLATVVDLTERRRTEQELLRHRQELAHVSRVSIMGELSASMAHELNQPLTAILSNAQAAQRFMAAGQPDMKEFGEILRDIAHDTTRARDVIRQLRALVKKEVSELTRLDLNETIREVVGFLHGDIVARNVRLELDLAADLAPIWGSRIQLQQVMINLLLNAFDAMNGQPVAQRRVTVLTQLESPLGLRVAVRDCGVGIEPGKLGNIFEPFYTTKAQGMGMGLSICRSIVEEHRGRLSAENNAEGGATVYFTVPVIEKGSGFGVQGAGGGKEKGSGVRVQDEGGKK